MTSIPPTPVTPVLTTPGTAADAKTTAAPPTQIETALEIF